MLDQKHALLEEQLRQKVAEVVRVEKLHRRNQLELNNELHEKRLSCERVRASFYITMFCSLLLFFLEFLFMYSTQFFLSFYFQISELEDLLEQMKNDLHQSQQRHQDTTALVGFFFQNSEQL